MRIALPVIRSALVQNAVVRPLLKSLVKEQMQKSANTKQLNIGMMRIRMPIHLSVIRELNSVPWI